jgi:hypothetical protein
LFLIRSSRVGHLGDSFKAVIDCYGFAAKLQQSFQHSLA